MGSSTECLSVERPPGCRSRGGEGHQAKPNVSSQSLHGLLGHRKEVGFCPKCDRKAKEGFSTEYFVYSLKDHSGYWVKGDDE